MKKIIALAMAILIAAISIPLSLAGDTKGDVNGDNKVNSSDALVILQYVVGLHTGEISLQNGDLNGDNQINSTDALMVLQICVGLITTTSRETSATEPTETTTKPTTTKSTTATTTTHKDEEKLTYKVGDKLNCEFAKRYMIRLYSDGAIKYIPSGSTVGDSTGKTYKDYFLNLDSIEATVSKIEDKIIPYTYYDEDYNLVNSHKREISNYISVRYRGYTDKDLSKKRIYYVMRLDWDDDSFYSEPFAWHYESFDRAFNSSIDYDGNFDFTITYKIVGDISNYFKELLLTPNELYVFDSDLKWNNFIDNCYNNNEEDWRYFDFYG